LELWKNQMKQYSEGQLRIYTTFKVHFGFENYLSVIGNFEHRRCLTKLRISAHRLHIETGRYQGIPPHQRLCGQCDSGEVEDEIHFRVPIKCETKSTKTKLNQRKQNEID
jgi:hypothetical protein